MKVKVWARRTKGRILPWNRQATCVTGSLTTGVREAPDERKVIVLTVEGGETGRLQLFEPRLISAGGSELKFSGYECEDYCWVVQEWVCELQSESPVSDAEIRHRYGLPTVPPPR